MMAYRRLSQQQILLEENLDKMDHHYALQVDRLERLKNSVETLKAEAGQLNYISPRETIIFISSWQEEAFFNDAPDILWFDLGKQRDRSRFFRGLSLTSGMLLFLFLYVMKRTENSAKKTSPGFNHIL